MEALAGLDGMQVAFVGRPGSDGVFVFEAGAGAGVDEFIVRTQEPGAPSVTSSSGSPRGRGPAGRAWRTGEIVRCDDYRHDPVTAPWREWSLRWGWRSSAAVPLRDPHGRPIALLSLYANVPGFFAYPSRLEMLEQVQRVVEGSLSQLESSPSVASDVRSYTERRRYLDLLERGGVEMHFQPVVDLRTGRPAKIEALARLREGGTVVSPAEFLPAFGDEELLTLFATGLEQSLVALDRLEREGLTTGVSVNLPVSSGTDSRYVDVLGALLDRHPVDPGRVTLELLETGDVLGPLAQRRAAMDALKQLGVRLAQDDLGSGYSSLLRLRHFPFDEVKIDKNLVRSTDAAPRTALHFVRPITDIAHSLGMTVVMEGLETEGLVEAALQLGADGGQGYALARPMPLDRVAAWARGFRLGLDREQPRTNLGALAAHVAWEHQVTALRGDPARDAVLASLRCPLGAYLGGGSPATLVAAHSEVHEHALARRGSSAHRSAWEGLVSMLEDGR
jgi:EAL domain-containing protein (putative c-di-GMP-specific phosphodiesterase class I)